MDFAIVLSSVDNAEKANEIAQKLVSAGLVACVQITPVKSFYLWKKMMQEMAEFRLEMKIRRQDYAAVESALAALHPYDTPEIVMTPVVAGFKPYLDWIAARERD